MAGKQDNKAPGYQVTSESNYLAFASPAAKEPANPIIADRYHHTFVSFLSLVLRLQIDLVNLTWQPALRPLGVGGIGQVNTSNLVTGDLACAFKRTAPRPSRPVPPDRRRYRALLSEILVLSHPEIRQHPNITSLLGVSWEFCEGSVWPVLVFPTANLGSLAAFIHGADGVQASLEDLIRICTGIAFGLDVLHRNNIVHGDLNPNNILVSKENGAYVPKLTDFESSCMCTSDDDLVWLPRTEPWEAPEWHARGGFRLKTAKRMDIYSFGLVCFVTMFQNVFSMAIVEVLPGLKSQNEIPSVIDSALDRFFDISEHQKQCISRFFKGTVCPEPEKRELDFENLIRLLTFDQDFRLLSKSSQTGQSWPAALPDPHKDSIISEFVSLSNCDFRVRLFLLDTLKAAAEDSTCADCAASAAFSLALGWKVGFFTSCDEETISKYLSRSGSSSAEFDSRVQLIQRAEVPRRWTRLELDYIAMWDDNVIDTYRVEGLLASAKDHVAKEVELRTRILGEDHVLSINAKLQLLSILEATCQWNDASRVIEEMQEVDGNIGGLSRRLAAIRAGQGRWEDAERLLTGMLDKATEIATGEIDALMKNNMALKEKYKGTHNEGKLDRMGLVLEMMGKDPGELMSGLGDIFHQQAKYSQAVNLRQKVVNALKEELGTGHLHTLCAMLSLANSLLEQGAWADAFETSEAALVTMKKLVDESDPRLLKGELLFGRILSFTTEPQETIDCYKRIIERQTKALGTMHLDTLTSEQTLAGFYVDQDMLGPAVELQEYVVERSKIAFGLQHPLTIRGQRALGTALERQGNTDRGIELISAAVEESRSLLGESHPDSISARIALSRAFCARGRSKEAKILGEEALKIVVDRYGENHPISISALVALAAVYSALELTDEASSLLKRATEIAAATAGPKSLEMISLLSKYAEVVSDREEAEQIRRRVAELRQRRSIEASARTLSGENHLAASMMQNGRWQEAEGILAKILKASRETLGPNHETTITIWGNFALCHGGLGDWDLARDELELIVSTLSATVAEDSPLVLQQKINLASALMRTGKLEEAASLQEALLETTKRVNGDDHDETMRVMNNLAATYSRQGRRSDALALILQEAQLTAKKSGKESVRTTNVWARFNQSDRFMEE